MTSILVVAAGVMITRAVAKEKTMMTKVRVKTKVKTKVVRAKAKTVTTEVDMEAAVGVTTDMVAGVTTETVAVKTEEDGVHVVRQDADAVPAGGEGVQVTGAASKAAAVTAATATARKTIPEGVQASSARLERALACSERAPVPVRISLNGVRAPSKNPERVPARSASSEGAPVCKPPRRAPARSARNAPEGAPAGSAEGAPARGLRRSERRGEPGAAAAVAGKGRHSLGSFVTRPPSAATSQQTRVLKLLLPWCMLLVTTCKRAWIFSSQICNRAEDSIMQSTTHLCARVSAALLANTCAGLCHSLYHVACI